MIEPFCATWKLVDSQNFDDYMEAIGVPFGPRQVANATKTTVTIMAEGDRVLVRTLSTFRNTEYIGTFGEEFDEITPDDRHVKSTFTMEGDKFVHTQRWDGKETKLVREIKDGKMVMTVTFEGVTAVRTYEKVKRKTSFLPSM